MPMRTRLDQFTTVQTRCKYCGVDAPETHRPYCPPIVAAKKMEAPEKDNLVEGVKYDTDKARYDLIPADALEALANHYRYGAKKYEDRNWEKGIKYSRIFAAMMRHAWAFWRGEEIDEESGAHHMVAVAWCAFALFHYWNRKQGELDDRVR